MKNITNMVKESNLKIYKFSISDIVFILLAIFLYIILKDKPLDILAPTLLLLSSLNSFIQFIKNKNELRQQLLINSLLFFIMSISLFIDKLAN